MLTRGPDSEIPGPAHKERDRRSTFPEIRWCLRPSGRSGAYRKAHCSLRAFSESHCLVSRGKNAGGDRAPRFALFHGKSDIGSTGFYRRFWHKSRAGLFFFFSLLPSFHCVRMEFHSLFQSSGQSAVTESSRVIFRNHVRQLFIKRARETLTVNATMKPFLGERRLRLFFFAAVVQPRYNCEGENWWKKKNVLHVWGQSKDAEKISLYEGSARNVTHNSFLWKPGNRRGVKNRARARKRKGKKDAKRARREKRFALEGDLIIPLSRRSVDGHLRGLCRKRRMQHSAPFFDLREIRAREKYRMTRFCPPLDFYFAELARFASNRLFAARRS